MSIENAENVNAKHFPMVDIYRWNISNELINIYNLPIQIILGYGF